MDNRIKKLPKSQIEIEIKLSSLEFQNFVEKATFQLGQEIKIEGFRKGKIPKKLLEEKIGKEQISKTATELAIKDNYLKIVSQNSIEAIGSPEVEILSKPETGSELLFKVRVSVLPEISLPDYKKIADSCKKGGISVKAGEVEEIISWLQRSRAKFSQISRPAQKGDFIEIEFFSPDIEESKKQKDAFVLGQGYLIPGFEENLEGTLAGQEKNFSLQFPEKHFQKNLAGKKIDFELKVISVQKMELPEMNDQFVQSLGKFENLEALKRNINQGLNLEKEAQEKQRLRQEILKKIIDNIAWEIPEVLITAEKNRIFENFKKDIQSKSQNSFEDYLKKVGQTEKEIKESFTPEAETRIKGFLALNKISTAENIQVSEDEVKAEVNKVLSKYPSTKEAEKELTRQNFGNQNLGGLDLEKLKLYIENELKNEKTLEKLESFSEL